MKRRLFHRTRCKYENETGDSDSDADDWEETNTEKVCYLIQDLSSR